MDEVTRLRCCRTLTFWLRHKPERAGVTLSKEGWATFEDLCAAFEREGMPMTTVDLHHMIRLDDGDRFELDRSRVRARFGHSLDLESGLHAGKPPASLFFAISQRLAGKALAAGLHPFKRKHLQFSLDDKLARSSAQGTSGPTVVLKIAAHEAFDSGIEFYPRGKGVWLAGSIGPQFLEQLDMPAATPAAAVTKMRNAARTSAPGTPRRRRPKGGFTH